jgi:hypothetical protein
MSQAVPRPVWSGQEAPTDTKARQTPEVAQPAEMRRSQDSQGFGREGPSPTAWETATVLGGQFTSGAECSSCGNSLFSAASYSSPLHFFRLLS